MRSQPSPPRSRTRGQRTATGPIPVMISRSGRCPWRTNRRRPSLVSLSAWQLSKLETSASTACARSARAPLRKTSVSGSVKVPGCESCKTLVSVTAYHSFAGEVEASSTTTIRRLTLSRRHQLSPIAQKSKREERKGNRGGNCLKGCMLAVPRCSGGLVPNISGSMGSDCGPLRRPSSAQKAVPFRRLQDGGDSTGLIMNESSRSKGVKNVLSLQVARERTRQAKAASDRQISERSNQRLRERLEAENAQLRDCVVELMLEIQALDDGAK